MPVTLKKKFATTMVIFSGTRQPIRRVAEALGMDPDKALQIWRAKGRPRRIEGPGFFEPSKRTQPVPVTIVGMGEFPSMSEAARALGKGVSAVQVLIKNHGTVIPEEAANAVVLRSKKAVTATVSKEELQSRKDSYASKSKHKKKRDMPTDEWFAMSDVPRDNRLRLIR